MATENLQNEVDRLKAELDEKTRELEEAQLEKEAVEQRRLSSLAEDLIALIAEKSLASMPEEHDLSQSKWVRESCFEFPNYGEKVLPRDEAVHLFGIYDRKGYESVCPVERIDSYALENVVITVVLNGQRPEVQRLLREHQ